jgi:ABC-type multidrug transport system ATPase subunit
MLSVRDLELTYPDGTSALRGMTLDVSKGVLGLLGPNGAGKSSLMRVVATLQAPTAGSVHFDEIDVLREPARLRRMLGYLPQEFGVYPGVTLREMLDHMAVLKGVADRAVRKDIVDGLLARVALWDARDRVLATLSGGMKRRFGVAQALIGDPGLLLLDEPSAGLDPTERNRLLDLLAEAGDRAVVVVSTHLVEEVAAVCSRVALLAGGRVRLDGTPAELTSVLRGRVWERTTDRNAAPLVGADLAVISRRLIAGRTVLRVLADERPGRIGRLPILRWRTSTKSASPRRKAAEVAMSGPDLAARIVRFELRLQTRSPVFLIVLAVSALMVVGSLTVERLQVGPLRTGNRTSTEAVLAVHLVWSLFFLFTAAAFAAEAALRDETARFREIVRSTPAPPTAVAAGRLGGSILAVLLSFLSVPAALILAPLAPWAGSVAPPDLLAVGFGASVLAAPNLVLATAVFFALAKVARSAKAAYLGAIALLVLYGLGSGSTGPSTLLSRCWTRLASRPSGSPRASGAPSSVRAPSRR